MRVSTTMFAKLKNKFGFDVAFQAKVILEKGHQALDRLDDVDKKRLRGAFGPEKAKEIEEFVLHEWAPYAALLSTTYTPSEAKKIEWSCHQLFGDVCTNTIPRKEMKIQYQCNGRELFPSRVIKSGPAFIVLWNDGTKTIIKKQKGDRTDDEKAMALCWTKKLFGNTGHYYDMIKMGLNLVEERK